MDQMFRPKNFGRILAGLGLLLGPHVLYAEAQASPPLPLTMVTTEESDHSYRSTGELSLPWPAEDISSRMKDFRGYDDWAPRGQDGRDPVSARYIGQLTGVRSSPGILDLVYRINLFWPFGSSGQIVRLLVTLPPGEPGTLTRVHFLLKDPSFAVLKLEGDFSLIPKGPQESTIRFDSQMKLAWFLRPFFPLDAYRTHVVTRIETALRSFAQQGASSP